MEAFPNLKFGKASELTENPCGAKLLIIALISGAVLDGAWWAAPCAYFLGIASGIILKNIRPFMGDVSPNTVADED
jgi:hypothetical protein